MKHHLPDEELGAGGSAQGVPGEWYIEYPGAESEPGSCLLAHADDSQTRARQSC